MVKAKDTRTPAYWEPNEKWWVENKNSVMALKSLHSGTANEGQQKNALAFILSVLCQRNHNQYFESQADTNFALGKKFVADIIVQSINANLGQIKEPNNERSSVRKPGRRS